MIEVTDLRVSYGDLRAVDGLNLSVPEGCLFGLLGPNGAGKTTTLGCICGLKRPDAGTILVAGVDVAREPDRARALIGSVPQELALYGDLSVQRNLRFFGAINGLHGGRLRDRVDWALEVAGLESKARARVETLSGGMKRRLNFVCSLLHDPSVIICDEPTTGVDAQSRHHLFEAVLELHRQGRTVLYTTHYMEEIEILCERAAIVDHGRVIASDTLDALVADANTSRAQYCVEAGSGASGEAIEDALERAGLPVHTVSSRARSLEDLFLELTGHSLRDDA